MSIIRVVKNKSNPYLIMNKTALNDSRLSLKAKGLFCYLLSKPDNWYVNTQEIVSNSSDGINSVRSSINELVRFGYMYKHRFRNNNGTFYNYNYLIFECPQTLDQAKTTTYPEVDNPLLDKPPVDNRTLLINKTKIINRTPLTTLYNKSNSSNVAQKNLSQKASREQTALLLYELHISNHDILFDSFDDFDIFTYADWMLTFKSRIKNPTGFIISALKGKYLDTSKYWKLSSSFNRDSD